MTQCQHCKGDTAFVAAIIYQSEVIRDLKHFGIAHEAPAMALPRCQKEPFEFDAIEDLCETKATMEA
jgi:hypothetical protein